MDDGQTIANNIIFSWVVRLKIPSVKRRTDRKCNTDREGRPFMFPTGVNSVGGIILLGEYNSLCVVSSVCLPIVFSTELIRYSANSAFYYSECFLYSCSSLTFDLTSIRYIFIQEYFNNEYHSKYYMAKQIK